MGQILELQTKVHANAKEKGFYEGEKNTGEMLALIHAEVSEALEADRAGKYCTDDDVRCVMLNINSANFPEVYKNYIKGTFDEEMADIVIRVLDFCAFKGIDLESHIEAKMKYNSMREYKHGKKY